MLKRLTNSRIGIHLIGLLVRGLIRVLTATTRWTVTGDSEGLAAVDAPQPVIGAFWHNRLLLIGKACPPGRPLGMVMSEHGDSRILGTAYAGFVTDPIFGSTRKGPTAALKGMIRVLRRGIDVAITPDGPRGPRMRCRPGVVEAARVTGAPIIPVAWSTSRRKVVGSWDRFLIPLPFGRGVLLYGAPIFVPRDADADTVEACRLQVEAAITRLTNEADRQMGHAPIEPAEIPPGTPEAES